MAITQAQKNDIRDVLKGLGDRVVKPNFLIELYRQTKVTAMMKKEYQIDADTVELFIRGMYKVDYRAGSIRYFVSQVEPFDANVNVKYNIKKYLEEVFKSCGAKDKPTKNKCKNFIQVVIREIDNNSHELFADKPIGRFLSNTYILVHLRKWNNFVLNQLTKAVAGQLRKGISSIPVINIILGQFFNKEFEKALKDFMGNTYNYGAGISFTLDDKLINKIKSRLKNDLQNALEKTIL